MKRHHQRRCPRRVSHGSFILLGTSDGLKGCASPTGKRRLRALTPSSAPSSWLTCRVALTLSAPEVSFLLCAQGDISILRRHHQMHAGWPQRRSPARGFAPQPGRLHGMCNDLPDTQQTPGGSAMPARRRRPGSSSGRVAGGTRPPGQGTGRRRAFPRFCPCRRRCNPRSSMCSADTRKRMSGVSSST